MRQYSRSKSKTCVFPKITSLSLPTPWVEALPGDDDVGNGKVKTNAVIVGRVEATFPSVPTNSGRMWVQEEVHPGWKETLPMP
jgi:hypothetical protein